MQIVRIFQILLRRYHGTASQQLRVDCLDLGIYQLPVTTFFCPLGYQRRIRQPQWQDHGSAGQI